MENLQRPTQLKEINWPVFKLSEKQPLIEGGVVFYQSDYADRDNGSTHSNVRIIDNRNLPYPTLGRRRLQLQADNITLYPIGKALYFLSDLIKTAKASTWFLDNHGKLFQRQKTQRAVLECYPIQEVFPTEGLGAVVQLKGIPTRFKTAFKPHQTQGYAGVLKLGVSYIFYGYYTEPFKKSWRMV